MKKPEQRLVNKVGRGFSPWVAHFLFGINTDGNDDENIDDYDDDN